MPDTLVAIVPVHNGGRDVHACLSALREASLDGSCIVVVDDASTDGAAREAAERYGCGYLMSACTDAQIASGAPDGPSSPGPQGPARARNRGAAWASASPLGATLLLFVDADVTVHADAVTRFRRVFSEQPGLAAAFGSYDDEPSDRGWISRYKNLLHHRMHQGPPRPASTFWSGCGAVRTTVFERFGGFDERYTGATIEDIEFGMRLHAAGETIALRPDILCTHHKRWTLRGWLRTDILGRALPWSRLLVERAGKLPDTLNVSRRERLTAAIVCSMPVCVLLVMLGTVPTLASIGFAASLAAFLWLQRDLLAFFARRGGTGFALAAGAMHIAYYLYSSLTFALVRLRLV